MSDNFLSRPSIPRHRSQRGAVLLVSLVILTVLTILGMSAIDSSGMQTRMASNQKERLIAMQAAEAALREAESFIEQGGIPSEDLTSLPASCSTNGICFEGSGALTPASCTSVPPVGSGSYLPQEIREEDDPFEFYNPAAPGDTGAKPIELGLLASQVKYARYTITFKCYVPGTPGDLVTVDPHQLYRIVAFAETTSGRGRVMLASTYKKRP